MLSFKLPAIDTTIQPIVKDAKSCKDWLATLPLTNVHHAHPALLDQLELINRSALDPMERLRIIELLREPIHFVNNGMARRYMGKSVPLNASEQAAWRATTDMWQAATECYLRCLQSSVEGVPSLVEHEALLTQRALRYIGLRMIERFRTYQEVAGELFHELHSLYAHAEARGFTMRPVRDSLNRMTETSSCAAVYLQALLADMAHPYQLSPKQLDLLDRWLDKWATRVPILREPPALDPLPVLCVDLDSSDGLTVYRRGQAMSTPRFLDTTRLANGLRKRIKFLRRGGSPAEIDIGGECTQPACETFLAALYQHWCEPTPGRACERHGGALVAQVCFGMPAIHYFVAGKRLFSQPREKEDMSWEALQNLQVFGRTHHAEIEKTLDFPIEAWEILDENALGFRIERRGKSGSTLGFHHLLALRPSDSKHFLIGTVRWIMTTTEGRLQLGVKSLPGKPVAIAARVPGSTEKHRKFVPALMLPAVAPLKSPASLVLPNGWFAPGKVVEIMDSAGQTRQVMLDLLLDKGGNFEQATFKLTA